MTESRNATPSVKLRALHPADVSQLATLLEQHAITMVGVSGRTFLSQVLNDACQAGSIDVVLARADDQIIGWTIAVINPRAYWKRFMVRHPLTALRILRAQLGDRVGRSGPVSQPVAATPPLSTPELPWTEDSETEWGESSDHVARHIDITLLEAFRRSGLGSELQSAQLSSLNQLGVSRMDATISRGNENSIRFHIKQGWTLARQDDSALFIFKETA